MIFSLREGRRNLLAGTAAVLVNLLILGLAPLLLRPDRTPPEEIEPPVRLQLPSMAEAPPSPEPAQPPSPPEIEPPAPESEAVPPPPEPIPPEVDVPEPPPDLPVPTVETAPPPPVKLPASRVPVRVRPRVAEAPAPPTAAPPRPAPTPQPAAPRRPAPAASSRTPEPARPPARRGPYAAGEVDQPPSVMNHQRPAYPYMARRRGVQGVVRVRFLVDREGRVRNLEILEADPPGVFEDAVREAIPAWRFRPGRQDGRTVETLVELPIRFELD